MDFNIKRHLGFFSKFERKIMEIIIRLVVRYYLKKPSLSELILIKVHTFKAGLFVLTNEICYLLGLEKSFRLTSLSIEVTNHCNLACFMCPVGTRMKRPKGFMEEGLFRRIIDDNLHLEFIFLFQWGEPFLHPKIFEFIEYASAKNIRTMVTTNGTFFSDEIIERILDSGLERLTFSVDGVGTTYTRIRGFGYEQLKASILKLKKLRDYKKSGLKIDISMVVFEETAGDIEKFMDEWGDIADAIYLIPRFVPGIRKNKCREMWRGNLTVLWDGRVVGCCSDFDGKMVVGDATKEDISSIWNGEQAKQLRRLHSRRVFTGVCSNCGEYADPRANMRFS